MELPRIERQAQDAIAALEPWKPVPIRAPASVTEPLDEGARSEGKGGSRGAGGSARQAAQFVFPPIPAPDREAWKTWAEDRLKEAQVFEDWARQSREHRAMAPELSLLATEVVVFHGYARKGDVARMETSLKRISELSQAASLKACPK